MIKIDVTLLMHDIYLSHILFITLILIVWKILEHKLLKTS